MTRWQYMLVDLSERKTSRRESFTLLDKYGADGWELVSALAIESSHPDHFINRLWFKRPVAPKRRATPSRGTGNG